MKPRGCLWEIRDTATRTVDNATLAVSKFVAGHPTEYALCARLCNWYYSKNHSVHFLRTRCVVEKPSAVLNVLA